MAAVSYGIPAAPTITNESLGATPPHCHYDPRFLTPADALLLTSRTPEYMDVGLRNWCMMKSTTCTVIGNELRGELRTGKR